MRIIFFKYQACGNDFIIINNFNQLYTGVFSTSFIKFICDRHIGVGADGLIILNKSLKKKINFNMEYYNSDGCIGSMCGNGSRSAVVFFKKEELFMDHKIIFEAYDGIHNAIIYNDYTVSVKLSDVSNIENYNDYYFLNTGSPHHIVFVDNIFDIDVAKEGSRINNTIYNKKEKVNINFVQIYDNSCIQVRTYERGVDNETLSCGTGSVASAIISYFSQRIKCNNKIKIVTLGGELFVSFKNIQKNIFHDVWLSGDVKFVFKGSIYI